MNEVDSSRQDDHALLVAEASDEALECAAGWERGKSTALTLAFCTGVDSCPSARA